MLELFPKYRFSAILCGSSVSRERAWRATNSSSEGARSESAPSASLFWTGYRMNIGITTRESGSNCITVHSHRR